MYSTLLLLVLLATAARAALPAPAAQHEAEAKRLEQQIVAPCCWRQQVSIHDSGIAQEIRQDIRTRLARGETSQHVLDAYVQQYGTAILVEPPAEGLSVMLYVLPPVVLLASGAILVLVIRRFTRRPNPAAEPVAVAPATAGANYVQQLDNDLNALD
jgi:cytochrome c-type biogenesis protein CcmH